MLILSDESKTLLLGAILSKICIMGCVIYLNGHIGTGKTVLCKGFLQGLGYQGYIKSPTYTLIESYCVSNINIYHCDCYRLNSKEELINIGIQDYYDGKSILLIEWPKQDIRTIILPDIIITMNYDNVYETYRRTTIQAISDLGQIIIRALLNTKKFKYEIKI